jgi:hypothetical protein
MKGARAAGTPCPVRLHYRGPHEGGEGRMKAARAAETPCPVRLHNRGPHEGGEGRMKAARAAGTLCPVRLHNRGPHEGGEGRRDAIHVPSCFITEGRMKAAKRPLLDGGASVAAGGPAANRWSDTASTIWLAAKSTIRFKRRPGQGQRRPM